MGGTRCRYVAHLRRTSMNFKPPEQVHVDPRAKFLASRSQFHKAFCAYDEEAIRMGRAEPVAAAKDLTVLPACALASPSIYKQDFKTNQGRRRDARCKEAGRTTVCRQGNV